MERDRTRNRVAIRCDCCTFGKRVDAVGASARLGNDRADASARLGNDRADASGTIDRVRTRRADRSQSERPGRREGEGERPFTGARERPPVALVDQGREGATGAGRVTRHYVRNGTGPDPGPESCT